MEIKAKVSKIPFSKPKVSEIPFSKIKALGNKISIKRYQFIQRDSDPIVEVEQCYVLGNRIHVIMHNNKTNEDMAFQRIISDFASAKLLETGKIVAMYDECENADMLRLNPEYSVGVIGSSTPNNTSNAREQFYFVIFQSTGLVVAVDDSAISLANILETKELGHVLFIPTDMGYGATGVLVTEKGELYNIGAYRDDGDIEINMINLHNKLSTYYCTKIDRCDDIEFLKVVK